MLSPSKEELQKQIEYFRQENQLRTNWISLITHDRKELFGTLIWLLEALENGTISRDDFFNLLPEIKDGAIKNLKVINDTSEWIKTQYGNFKPREENVFLYELYLKLKSGHARRLQEKNLNLQFKGNENGQIETDPVLLSFILNKIIENAIQFSYPFNTIEFVVYEQELFIKMVVNNVGIPIPSNSPEEIFTFEGPKFEGTSGEKGAGLSLKIVNEFVKLMGAKIQILPNENGTSVFLQFPKNKI